MKSANNLETLNRSHMIFLPFFNAFSCCVLLSKFPFDHKQSTLNIIQNSLFSTTISSWHRKKKDVCEVSPSKCPNESTLWWTPEAAHLTELIHLWQLLQWTFSLISLSLCASVCVLPFYEPAAKWPAIEKASNLMASMGKLMPRWKIRRKCFRPAKRALKAKKERVRAVRDIKMKDKLNWAAFAYWSDLNWVDARRLKSLDFEDTLQTWKGQKVSDLTCPTTLNLN